MSFCAISRCTFRKTSTQSFLVMGRFFAFLFMVAPRCEQNVCAHKDISSTENGEHSDRYFIFIDAIGDDASSRGLQRALQRERKQCKRYALAVGDIGDGIGQPDGIDFRVRADVNVQLSIGGLVGERRDLHATWPDFDCARRQLRPEGFGEFRERKFYGVLSYDHGCPLLDVFEARHMLRAPHSDDPPLLAALGGLVFVRLSGEEPLDRVVAPAA